METLVYDSFEDIGKPEPLTDDNGNGSWDDGEAFIDVNGNGVWDEDMGEAGPRRRRRCRGLPPDLPLGRGHPDPAAGPRRHQTQVRGSARRRSVAAGRHAGHARVSAVADEEGPQAGM